MKEILLQYATYNHWANNVFCEYIKGLSVQQQHAGAAASFPSIQKTLQHMWEAETIWWKRLQLEENVPPPGAFEALPMDEVMARLPQQSAMTMKWVGTAREEKLAHVIAYRNSKRVEFKQPVFQILLQLFNHQTYHRGQLVCIFRQVAAVNIPNTDFINWSRKK